MFGCHAIYTRGKIVLILRKKENYTESNGVWVAIAPEHHAEMKKIMPPLRPLTLFETSAWLNLHDQIVDFEERVIDACELILKNDARIGKIPKPRKKKSASK